ncbi:MAG: hypothetical protein OXC46_11340 [Thaumarchaeota archaeon]|nr:hypothetical protein [Nitrososphaerota archaeon]
MARDQPSRHRTSWQGVIQNQNILDIISGRYTVESQLAGNTFYDVSFGGGVNVHTRTTYTEKMQTHLCSVCYAIPPEETYIPDA